MDLLEGRFFKKNMSLLTFGFAMIYIIRKMLLLLKKSPELS